MGLAVRVIPTLLKRGDSLVKGTQFNGWRSVGHIEQAARICGTRGVDETIMLDIGATPEGRGPDIEAVNRITDAFFTPITIGGGVRTVDDVQALLRAGADKVAIGSAAWETEIVRQASDKFGSQAVVLAIDVKEGEVYKRCGEVKVSDCPVFAASLAQAHGAGEILLTSIDYEGTMEGYDIELIRRVSHAVDVPVIAHGGCSGPEDMLKAIRAGASAVAAGALFQFSDHTPRSCAAWLAKQGIETRLPA